MLKVLLQKQLAEIFRTYFYNAKTNKARSRGATIAYLVGFALLMVGLLGGIFAYLSVSLCGALSAVGMDWLFFALMGLLAVFLGAFGSVFNTYSSLYLAKDNDLLLSMPIPVRTIMASRLLGVYLMGLMYSGVVILPAVIVYWIMISASAAAIAGGVLLVALISLFVLTLSCALGWVVAKISLKLKNKSFITVFVSLVFLGVYYFLAASAQATRWRWALCPLLLPHSSCCCTGSSPAASSRSPRPAARPSARSIARHAPSGSPPPPRCCGRSSPASRPARTICSTADLVR